MSYKNLKVPQGIPRHVRDFVKKLENYYFHDIHCMLRLPLSHYSINAGCNFAITQALMNVISGASTTLYMPRGRVGPAFKSLLVDYYPWDVDPPVGASKQHAAKILYETFRNPLTHNVGLDVRTMVQAQVVKTKRQMRQRSGKANFGMTERAIEKLERNARPAGMSATLTVRSDATVLYVEGFYWGSRQLIQRLLYDISRMSAADRFLTELCRKRGVSNVEEL